MKKGSYKITNKLAKRELVSVGGESYVFEAGEVRILELYPYEAAVFQELSSVFTVVELEAGEDPSEDLKQTALNDTEAVLYHKKKGRK